ncbi:MAG: hypothetical protein U1E05_17200, partial [Patescibacteria group bacterium]|nr:hypothetical protein [Patescibacteria group bacterium]
STMTPVRGVVTLDGQPVAGAAVMFMPNSGGRPAIGVTDKDGGFSLQTETPGDGALLGEHAVTVTLQETSGIATDPDGLSGEIAPGGIRIKWIVPQRYSDPKTSNLTATVARDMEPVVLTLTSQ